MERERGRLCLEEPSFRKGRRDRKLGPGRGQRLRDGKKKAKSWCPGSDFLKGIKVGQLLLVR